MVSERKTHCISNGQHYQETKHENYSGVSIISNSIYESIIFHCKPK